MINNLITVKNCDNETKAEIITQNKIDFIPKVSVVIPVYNVEPYLRQCLDSVINQTLKDIEIICIDDGSTDNSLSILKEYAEKDNRITVLSQQNLHAGVARNAGLAVAKGEYLSFIDSDDYITLNYYEMMLEKIDEYNADFSFCCWDVILENGSDRRYDEDYSMIKISGFHYISSDKKSLINVEVWNKLFRKSLVEKYNIKFPNTIYGEDSSFVTQYLLISKTAYGIKEKLYLYRMRNNSLMGIANKRILDSYQAIKYTLKFIQKNKISEKTYSFFIYRLENTIRWISSTIVDQQSAKKIIENIDKNIIQNLHFSDLSKLKILYKFKEKDYNYIYKKLFPELFDSFISFKKMYDLQKTKIKIGDYFKYIPYKKKDTTHSIDIAFILDRQYFDCTYIAIVSAIHNKLPETFLNIHIVYTNLSYRQQKLLLNLNNKDIQVEIIGFDAEKYSGIKNVNHISNTALIKFDLPNIFSKLDKILYLDGDTYISKDLTDLYNIDLFHNYIAATKEVQATLWKYQNIIGTEHYINSGVMLMNLKQMRLDNISAKMIELKLHQPKTWKCMDQDVFNKICDKRIHFLNINMNCTISIFLKREWNITLINSFFNTHYKSMNDMCDNATILHFAGDYKPWIFNLKLANITKKYLEIYKHSLLSYKMFTLKKLHKITIHNSIFSIYHQDLIKWYYEITGKHLNLDNPKTFNEKIQWLKLYDSTPIKTRLADKYLVRDWVKEKIGEEYLIELLGVYDRFEDIDFDKLPDRFVIKCNHGSGYNIIVKDKSKLDLSEVKAKLDKWMAEDYAFRFGYELHYSNIERKIIIEKFMEDFVEDLYDYRFFCCSGKVEQIWLDVFSGTPQHKRKIYDRNWKELNFTVKWPRLETEIEKPENLSKMISLAESLSQGFALVRVDFYNVNSKIYFGEMTFTSMSGTGVFSSKKADLALARKIKLPEMAYDINTEEYYKLPKLSWFDKLKRRRQTRKQKEKLIHKAYKKLCQTLRTGKTEIINKSTDYTTLAVKSKKANVLAIENGSHYQLENKQLQETIKLKVNGKCPISLKFSSANGYPLVYKSIKINKKEILGKPIQLSADCSFDYDFIAKPDKKNKIEVQKQYYPFKKHDLKIMADNLELNKLNQKRLKKVIRRTLKTINGGFWSKLFSVRYKDNKKIVRILGLKFKFKL